MLLENNPYPQDTRVRNEARTLAAAGHEVTVIAPRRGGQPRRERVDGVRVHRFRLPDGRGAAGLVVEYVVAHVQLGLRGAVELLRGADAVHLHNPPDTLFPVAWLARALGRRAVFDMHDLTPELFGEKFGFRPLERLLRGAQLLAVRAAHRVIATNETQREVALARGAGAVHVVRNGPPAAAVADGPRVRPGAEPRLVFVGELAEHDGVLDLPRLLADPRLARARMTVVGDGPARAAMEAEAARHDVAERIAFTGQIAHADALAAIRDADIAVDPAPANSLTHGSTMIKIAEYLACGVPVVAYDLRETRRTAGDAARYAPPGDARRFATLVAEVAANSRLRADLARRALARAPQLTFERSQPALLEVYAAL